MGGVTGNQYTIIIIIAALQQYTRSNIILSIFIVIIRCSFGSFSTQTPNPSSTKYLRLCKQSSTPQQWFAVAVGKVYRHSCDLPKTKYIIYMQMNERTNDRWWYRTVRITKISKSRHRHLRNIITLVNAVWSRCHRKHAIAIDDFTNSFRCDFCCGIRSTHAQRRCKQSMALHIVFCSEPNFLHAQTLTWRQRARARRFQNR